MISLNTILDLIFHESSKEELPDFPFSGRESAEWIFPVYDYRHLPLRKAVRLLKYRGRRKLADIFGDALRERMLEELSDLSRLENFREPILIPIPLSGKRQKERGYNQAALIADRLSLPIENNILWKTRETEHQARARTRGERLKNIVGTFAVKEPDKAKDRNIILIDDVVTTGATLAEAKKALEQAGARRVIAFTVAH